LAGKTLRVAHVIPSASARLGGPAKALIAYVQALHQVGGIKQTIWTTTRLMTAGGTDGPATLSNWAVLRIFPATGDSSRSFSPLLAVRLWKDVRRFDLIHIHGLLNPVSLFSAWICRLRGVPFIIRPLGSLSPLTYPAYHQGAKGFYYVFLARPLLRSCRALHCTSAGEAEKVRQWIPRNREVVPIPYFPQGPGTTHQRRWSNHSEAPDGPATILFLSRLHPKKNLPALLEAVSILKSQPLPPFLLVVAGEGPPGYERFLRERARILGICRRIRWAGFVQGKEKARCLAQADVFVLPSLDENFGMAVVEAMANGIPVVVGPGVDLAALIRQYDAGRVVSPAGADLAREIRKLLCDADLRLRLGSNGRRLVSECFDPHRVARQLMELYQKTVQTAP
jgi:glycosyltransferase involved in cell wall biosynthesis